MLIGVPRLAAIEDSALGGAMHVLFLSAPVEAETARSILAGQRDALHWLTSGPFGRIDSTTERLDAIRSYSRLADDERKVPWAASIVRSRDEMLQRSALFELAKPLYAEDGNKYALLGATAIDDVATESTKDLAVELLELAESPRALTPLRDIAIAGATPAGRRLTAIRSIGRLPGGEMVLADLQRQADTTIRRFAEAEIQRLLGQDPAMPTPVSVLAGLGSTDVATRSRAIYDLGRIPNVPGTLPDVIRLLEARASTNAGERMALVEHLAELNTAESAEALGKVALDRTQPEALRNAAILALANMGSSASSAALRQLAASLEDGTLRQIAELLVE